MSDGFLRHYDAHLGSVYTWMAGGFDAASERALAALTAAGVGPGGGRLAADLGCGPGFHALPLASLGYRVAAWDLCAPLVAELRERAAGFPIEVHQADIRGFRSQVSEPAALVVCLGDTLTHLPSLDAVGQLIVDIAAALGAGGTVVLSFRDYVTAELAGDARFIPVRSDADRILTCFLDYAPGAVRVHDLLHSRTSDGWALKVSSYSKIRLPVDWVEARLAAAGLRRTVRTLERGMVTLAATKPN